MSTEMRASVLVTLKDQLTAAAAKYDSVFKPLEKGVKSAVETLKTLGKTGDETVSALDKIGAAAEAMGGKAQKGAKDVADAMDKIKKAPRPGHIYDQKDYADQGRYDTPVPPARSKEWWAAEHQRRIRDKDLARAERDRALRDPLETRGAGDAPTKRELAKTAYDEAKGPAAKGVAAAGALVVPPTLAAAAQEQASARIKMVTDMTVYQQSVFDRAMLKLQERNVYSMKHSYDAAENAARLGVYKDALAEHREPSKAVDALVHWVDMVEQYAMMWKTAPGLTGEKLKFLKNQFHLGETGLTRLADQNSLLSHNFGYKAGAMVDYLTGAGAAMAQTGFSPDQVMALGAGPLAKGINASSTGTNLVQILNYMKTQRSTEAGASFGKLMGGETQAAFFERMKNDPWTATMDFFKNAKAAMQTAEGTADVSKVIGSRQIRNLANITESLDAAQAAYAMANSDEVDGYADRKAKELREGTLKNKMAMLKNSLVGGESMIGRVWLEHLKGAVDKGRDHVNGFNAWMRQSEANDGVGHKAVSYGVAAVAGLVALRGAMALAWLGGKLLGISALTRLPGVVAIANGAVTGLGFAFRRLATTSLVGGALYGGYKLVTHWTEIKASLTGIWADLKAAAADDSLFGSQKRRDAQDKFGEKLGGIWQRFKAGSGLQDGLDLLAGKDANGKMPDMPFSKWYHWAWDKAGYGQPQVPKDAALPGGDYFDKPPEKPPESFWDMVKRHAGGGKGSGAAMDWKFEPKEPKGGEFGPPGNLRFGPRAGGPGPDVPTLVGGRMAGEAQGGLPAGVTIQANGPQVSFRQAPPSITTHVTVNVAATNASPADIGGAVGAAVGGQFSGALYDGAQ